MFSSLASPMGVLPTVAIGLSPHQTHFYQTLLRETDEHSAFEAVDTLTGLQTQLRQGRWALVLASYDGDNDWTDALALAEERELPLLVLGDKLTPVEALHCLRHGATYCLSVGEEDELRAALQRVHRSIEQQQRQMLAEVQLREMALALQAMVEACPLAIIALDPQTNVLMWSRGAAEMFGWSEDEVLGRPLPTIPLGLEQQFQSLVDGQMQGQTVHDFETRRRRKDGSEITVSIWTAPLRDSDGNIRGKMTVLADISARKRAEQERFQLLAQEKEARAQAKADRRFRELLEAAPDSIIEVDREGRIVLLNHATERLFGYTREELLGQSVDTLMPDGIRAAHAQHRARYWSAPATRAMGSGLELRAQRKGGEVFPVEISLSPVKTEDDFRVTAVIRDVTERKQSEEEIRKLNERFTAELHRTNQSLELQNREIERANRLKSEFLASMSHELRTPLHTIIGFSELLGTGKPGPLNDKQKRFISHIHTDSKHLLELINDILDLSKIEAGRLELRPERFAIAEATEETLASIRPLAANKRLRLESVYEDSLDIEADRVRFKEILYNLLSNAVKFTPEGGAISVQVRREDNFASVTVKDTGIGIPPDEHANIFDNFYQVSATTKGVREGTGLGLAITKRLVNMHGGDLSLDSELGRGSSFTFTIPLASSPGNGTAS